MPPTEVTTSSRGPGGPLSPRTLHCRLVAEGTSRPRTHLGDLPPVDMHGALGMAEPAGSASISTVLLATLGGCLVERIRANAAIGGVTIRHLELKIEADMRGQPALGSAGHEPGPVGLRERSRSGAAGRRRAGRCPARARQARDAVVAGGQHPARAHPSRRGVRPEGRVVSDNVRRAAALRAPSPARSRSSSCSRNASWSSGGRSPGRRCASPPRPGCANSSSRSHWHARPWRSSASPSAALSSHACGPGGRRLHHRSRHGGGARRRAAPRPEGGGPAQARPDHGGASRDGAASASRTRPSAASKPTARR